MRRILPSALSVLVAAMLAGCTAGPAPSQPIQVRDDQKAVFPKAAAEAPGPNDWYRWRGPDLNGISNESGWSSEWPPNGPKPSWKADVGTGFSSVSVSRGRVFTLGNQNDSDTVYCFDAASGNMLWRYSYACGVHDKYYDGGPSATPAVDGGAVFTLSKAGDLICLEAATGKVIWAKNLQTELSAAAPSWGFAGSPLIEGNLVVVNVGDFGAALEKTSGKVVWTTGRSASGYASPVPFEIGGERGVAIFSAEAIVGVNLQNGKILWEHPWKTSYDVNAADPIIRGTRVFVTSGYGTGCGLIEFDAADTDLVWKNKAFRNQFSSCVLIGEYIYGIDGQGHDSRADLKCLEWETGKVRWSETISGTGTLMAADGKLIILSGRGELIIAVADPNQFKALARSQVLGGTCWSVPVLSNGRIYCRNSRGNLICLDVSGKS